MPTPAEPSAIPDLLRDLHERRGPLVKPLEGVVDRRGVPCSQVTFLFEAAGARSVSLSSPLNESHSHEPMQRVPGTDVWWTVRTAADDVRVSYQFCADDPLLDSDHHDLSFESMLAMEAERFPRTAPDPANPSRIRAQAARWSAPPEHWLSVLALPLSPPDPWHERRPAVPAGSVVQLPIESQVLGNERQLWVYTPPGYAPDGGPYPLVVLLDGREMHRVVDTPAIVDNLIAEGRIRPPVVVMMENPTEVSRFGEYLCNDAFTEFLAHELVPLVRHRFAAIASDAGSVIVGGVSAGGLASALAAWSRPEVFGGVISMSGSFFYGKTGEVENEWLTRQVAAADARPVRWWNNIGTLESKPILDTQVTMLSANRHLRTVLTAKGNDVTYSEYSGGHDWVGWRATLPNALMAMLGA